MAKQKAKKKELKTYHVEMTLRAEAFVTLEVQADSEEQAEELVQAMINAGKIGLRGDVYAPEGLDVESEQLDDEATIDLVEEA